MTRLLIIPAAGIGSRLGVTVPKVLVHVAGKPMLDHLLELYGGSVQRFVVIVSPSGREPVADHLRGRTEPVDLVVQTEPTGMLDAILLARSDLERLRPDRVWITWCDQVAVRQETVARLMDSEMTTPEPAMSFPTCAAHQPYIHFDRDGSGRIVAVLQRREGDVMPASGESDMGLFSLSRSAYLEDLGAYDKAAGAGRTTRERNFLPFIPWLAASRPVVSFPCTDPIEAVGINTPEELRRIDAHLRGGARRRGANTDAHTT